MDSLIIKRAEQKIRQKLFGGIVLFVTLLMLANTFGWVKGATDFNANVTFNITSGTFSIDNGPTQVRFGSNAYGYSGQVNATDKANLVAVTDYRGTSAAWSVAVNANDLTNGANIIYANKIKLYQDNGGTLTNVENATTSRVTLGSNGNLANNGITLMNTSSSPGIIRFDNGYFNLTLGGTESAGQYSAKIIFTLT